MGYHDTRSKLHVCVHYNYVIGSEKTTLMAQDVLLNSGG